MLFIGGKFGIYFEWWQAKKSKIFHLLYLFAFFSFYKRTLCDAVGIWGDKTSGLGVGCRVL